MGRLPTGRAGQALAVLLLAVVLAAAWIGVAAPLLDWHAGRADTMAARRTLARRMAQIAQTLPALQRQAAASPGTPAAAVLDGSTDAVAGAALQQAVQDMAARAGAVLASVEVLPGEQAGAYRRIGLRIGLNAPWPVLVGLLRGILDAQPGMVVDDMQVHGTRAFIRDPAAALDASWVVLAFRAGTAP